MPVDLVEAQVRVLRKLQDSKTNQVHSVDDDAAAMDANDKWPYPAGMEGWVLYHNSLRQDMESISAAADALAQSLASRVALSAWQEHHLKKFWRLFEERLRRHQEAEERILFPWLATRASLPAGVLADHGLLLGQLRACSHALAQLHCTANPDYEAQLLEGFQASFGTFKADCEAQLAEEERRCLPLMRRSFSCEELRPVEARMLGGQSLTQQAAFFHSMDEETREAYFRQAQTPWLVARLVILPKVHQYDRTTAKLLRQIIDGTGKDKAKRLFSK